MARDRERARQQRRNRRSESNGGGSGTPGNGVGPAPSKPERTDVPPDWEHGGEVDEFEASIVAGSGEAGAGEPLTDEELDREAEAAAPKRERRPATRPSAEAATVSGPGRFFAFLRASWAELQRVQWPDRVQVAQATGVVLGFVVIAGLYLGLADWVAGRIVDLIL